jgi:hypothetical protein
MMRSRTRLSVFATSVVVVLLLCVGLAIAFSDVPAGSDYAEAINELSSLGIINGKDDGTFRPRELVTRQQFAKMIVLTLDLPVSENDVCFFSDVDVSGPGNLFPDNFVAVAAAQGITKGVSGNSFAPFNNISRAQVMSMVVRAAPLAGVSLSQPTGSYFADTRYTQRLFDDPNHGLNAQIAEVSGLLWGVRQDSVGVWDPWRNATRGEVAQILWRLRQKMGPPITVPPTTEPPVSGLLKYDDFSNPNSGWAVATGDYFSVGYSGGGYEIEITAPDSWRMSWWPPDVYDDVAYASDVYTSTDYGSWMYGLVFRVQDGDNFYQLAVYGDDTATLWKKAGGQWTQISDLVDLTPTASDGWRHLAVSMMMDSFVAYVDDVAIGPVYDGTFTEGKMGYYVGTFNDSYFMVHFDEFAVWSPIVY